MNRRAGRRCRQGGFTLMELLIGIALLSLIAVLLTGSLRLGFRGTEALAAASEREEDRRVVWSVLRRHLEAAQPVAFPRPTRLLLAFEGAPDSLQFAAEMTARDGTPGIWLVRLAVEWGENDDHGRLVLTRRLLAEDAEGFGFDGAVERAVLLPEAAGLSFAYADAEGWRGRWSGEERLPRLVRLRLRDGEDPGWPDLVVAPPLGRSER